MVKVSDLDKRICDTVPGANNTQTHREWIHDISKFLGIDDPSDEELDNMTDEELDFMSEELDWLAWK